MTMFSRKSKPCCLRGVHGSDVAAIRRFSAKVEAQTDKKVDAGDSFADRPLREELGLSQPN